MTPTVVEFKPRDDAQQAAVEAFTELLEQAKRGEVLDFAVVIATRNESGPQHWIKYYGQEAYATIVAGTAALSFDLQYQRYKQDEGRA